MVFETIYILKNEEKEILGHVLLNTEKEKGRWFFMPSNKPLFKEDLIKITAKIEEAITDIVDSETTSFFDMFRRKAD